MAVIGAFLVVPGSRNPKTFRENHYYDGMNDRELRERYNFGREAIEVITGLVEDSIKRKTERNHALSPRTQVLITLTCREMTVGFQRFSLEYNKAILVFSERFQCHCV